MKKLKIFEANIPSGTDKNLNLFENVTDEQVNELTPKERVIYDTLIRLGDSPDLAYSTVMSYRGKENNDYFYRQAYESAKMRNKGKLPIFEDK